MGKANVDRFTFFQTLITIPVGTAPGAHRLVASGTGVDGAPLSLGTAITVVAPGVVAPGGGSGLGGTTGDAGSRGPIFGVTLPRTGTDAAIVGALGVVLVAVGGATIAASRRRAS
ncbi:MAG: LPXTG cell wall anchor domain-containing protein [Flavobacterium sp.]|nr:LPXTG cell wall anchor domain-containing protein [Aeromicrobium sp.]